MAAGGLVLRTRRRASGWPHHHKLTASKCAVANENNLSTHRLEDLLLGRQQLVGRGAVKALHAQPLADGGARRRFHKLDLSMDRETEAGGWKQEGVKGS